MRIIFENILLSLLLEGFKIFFLLILFYYKIFHKYYSDELVSLSLTSYYIVYQKFAAFKVLNIKNNRTMNLTYFPILVY